MGERSDPTGKFEEYAASDTDDVPSYRSVVGLYVGSAGNAEIQNWDGVAMSFTNLVAGQTYPIRPKRILSAGTSAGGFVVFYEQ